ncbi:MAG: hypothetical protein CML67_02170 [Rhodobacteraceae bacterium]|nr:hypothetical protein [Paracoccaceae bacterium]
MSKYDDCHFAAGVAAAHEGQPRQLPSYFMKPKNKNARSWLAGWDAAREEMTAPTEPTLCGLQYVIPGCEKREPIPPAQMDLF